MLEMKNIHPLTDFNRNTRAHLKRLRETGQPEVLTVNGRAEVVVQNAEAYQRLLDEVEYADTVRVLRQRLESYRKGQKGIPLDKAFAEIRAELGLPSEK
jgi:PHD/YefM family antitoxin component YafN of YafNO toxin-antitoxin module